MAKNFEANAHSIFAGSYERFLFGHSYGPNFSASFTAAGEEEFEKKRNNTKFLCTIDAHSQSIKSIAAAGPFFCSGGHDDRIRAFHVNTRGEISDVGSLTGHSGTVTCIAFAKPSIYGKREDDDDDGKKCTTKNNNNNNNNNNNEEEKVPSPTRMLSGSDDGTILVWQTYDFEILKKMLAHRNGVSGLSVHASGVVAVSCGKEDRSVALWDLKKGRVAYKGKTRGGEESGIDVFFSSKEEDTSGGGGKRYGLLTNKWLDVIDCESGGEVSSFTREDQREGRIGYRKCLCATSKEDSAENIYRIGYEGGDVCIFDAKIAFGAWQRFQNAEDTLSLRHLRMELLKFGTRETSESQSHESKAAGDIRV
jgi:WD40 repeat protein